MKVRTVRIIPTRMGTRLVISTPNVPGRDHPHAYGDKSIVSLDTPRITGSSPRVWGQAR